VKIGLYVAMPRWAGGDILFEFLNANSAAVTALATVALLIVTGWYAFITHSMLGEAKGSRLHASEPRVVAYLRAHDVHSNLVQLCIANLSGASAVGVTASLTKVTEWPTNFDLQDSPLLRDISFVRPQEVLKFDLGFGPDLFRDEQPAVFTISLKFSGLDGREFRFENPLKVESVLGPSWKVYGLDDIARRLKEISDTLQSFTGSRRLKVEIYDADDRNEERTWREEARERHRSQSAKPQD
jgi:hypothetical protein